MNETTQLDVLQRQLEPEKPRTLLDSPFTHLRKPTQLDPIGEDEHKAQMKEATPPVEEKKETTRVFTEFLGYLDSIKTEGRNFKILRFDLEYPQTVEGIRGILARATEGGQISKEEEETMLKMLGN